MQIACGVCGKPAVYFDNRSGKGYCELHFRQMLEKKVRKELRKQGLSQNERIVMGISGGKDSLVMMDLLWRVEAPYHVGLTALTVDEGIENGQYRGRRMDLIKRMAEERGIKHEVQSFRDKYGFTLDEAVQFLGGKEEPCTLCGVLRRRALNDYAKGLKATRLAIAHNLDDEAETVLMNVIRGDAKGLMRSENYAEDLYDYYVPRIKPMRTITERESAFYAYLIGIPPEEEECPYARLSLRDGARSFLEDVEARHPGTADSIVKFGESIKVKGKRVDRSFCSLCGYPTSKGRDICRVCEIKGMMREAEERV